MSAYQSMQKLMSGIPVNPAWYKAFSRVNNYSIFSLINTSTPNYKILVPSGEKKFFQLVNSDAIGIARN